MFNIARFSAHINNSGTVQTNKFIVRIPPPIILRDGFDVIQRSIEYRANSVKVPGVDLDTQNVSRYGVGPSQKFPTNVNFTDIDINFLDTNGNYIWKYFAKWMNGIFDYTGVSGGNEPSYKVEYKKYYQTNIEIFVFDNDGRQTNAIILKEAFPISLSDVSLSWSENNRLYEFSVRFSFREWFYSGYNIGVYDSRETIGPGQTAQVVPNPIESPRMRDEGKINPGGFNAEAQQRRKENFAQRGRNNGFYSPEQQAVFESLEQAENNIAGGAAGR
jgi:hypothetical protein